jgi:lysophospholipase L1-like esterase
VTQPQAGPSTRTLLFQGDSITDAGRDRGLSQPNDPRALGGGYPALIGVGLMSGDVPGPALWPEAAWRVFNRGISGNRILDLESRWNEDALAIAPDVLSILIGVNDTWRGQDNPPLWVSLETYEQRYRGLLERTRQALPETRLILCEPFVLRCGHVTDAWFPEFDQRRAIVRGLAEAFDARFVPFQSAFDEAAELAPPSAWAHDGVHPSVGGFQVMAQTWLKHGWNAL